MRAHRLPFLIRTLLKKVNAGLLLLTIQPLLSPPAWAANSDSSASDPGHREFEQLFSKWQREQGGQDGTRLRHRSAPRSISAAKIPRSAKPTMKQRISSGYGLRVNPVLGRRMFHTGMDLAARAGTRIYATADGVVGKAQWLNGYGLFVQIEHGGGFETRYGHLSRLTVIARQIVHKGDLIGYVGSTGRSTGNHLHYEVRVNGSAINPLPSMQARAPKQSAR